MEAEFQPSFERLRTIVVHSSAYFADGDTIFPDDEIILIFYFAATFHIQINKGLDVVLTAVNVIGHCIICRI